jgi:hypothetical protein
LSFFDEAEEPQPRQPTRRPRASGPSRPRSGRPPRGSGRPPGGTSRPPGGTHPPEVQTRRLIAVGVIVVLVLAMALLIKSCDSSATTSALKNYNASVYQLVSSSVSNAQGALSDLTPGQLAGGGTKLASAEQTAQANLRRLRALQAPSQMAAAQSALVTVLQLRAQGLELIAGHAQQATSRSTSKDAIYQISLGTSDLYASDVLYKTIATPDIARALNAANLPVGTNAGQQQINPAQVITDLGWLNQSWIADRLGAKQSTAAANANNDQPGLHGDSLTSVTVDNTALIAGVTNNIPASQARTWVLTVANGGNFNEYSVGCSVKIVSLSDTGTSTIRETYAHQSSSCTVVLPSTPTTGPFQVIASVAKVPGETDLSNNTLTYTVNFT